MPPRPRLGLSWQIGSAFGWGQYGYRIIRRAVDSLRCDPVLFKPHAPLDMDPISMGRLRRVLERIEPSGAKNFPVLHALGNRGIYVLVNRDRGLAGRPNLGAVFFEDTRTGPADFRRIERIITGSRWNQELLEARGADNARLVLQGVDPALFHPAPRTERFGDRFLIFSGGKFEFRKGQDIVLAAFARFRARHPEAQLIGVWGNPFTSGPAFRHLAHSPHIDDLPRDANGGLDIGPLMVRFGLTPNDALVFRSWPHHRLPELLRECDVALMPNRAEGGTNLVAMEAIACGVPTILSSNTGHRDIMLPGVIPLTRQGPVALPEFGTEGWGESDLEEIDAALESVWRDREAARAAAGPAARAIMEISWDRQVDRLFDAIGL